LSHLSRVLLCVSLSAVACAAQNAVRPSPSSPVLVAPLANTTPVLAIPQPPALLTLPPSTGYVGGTFHDAKPRLAFNAVDNEVVRDIHLKPLFETTIEVPAPVATLAVGAPTLFEVEHKDSDPLLVFVKPMTHDATESNLFISMTDGSTISIRLLSSGDAPSPVPVDFVVDYRGRKSLFSDAAGIAGITAAAERAQIAGRPIPTDSDNDSSTSSPGTTTSAALSKQASLGAPTWVSPRDLTRMIRANALAPNIFAISVGTIRQDGESMTVSFSLLNTSNHWITMMPPQVELTDPLITKKVAKKKGKFAQPLLASDYKLENPKLAPGERCDASVTFPKPDSKVTKEQLMLHIATSASIDTPMYYPLPFVAPSNNDLLLRQGDPNAL
jgi:hypothetical protein